MIINIYIPKKKEKENRQRNVNVYTKSKTMVLIINELSSYLHIIYYYQDGENPPACFVWSAGVVSRGRRA